MAGPFRSMFYFCHAPNTIHSSYKMDTTSTLNNTQTSFVDFTYPTTPDLQRNKRLCLPLFETCDQTHSINIEVMEALNSSCSKAMLGTHVPKSSLVVSNTPKFSFFLNDNKGCDFGLPKLVQNKGLSPLHAVPSKTMENLDNLVLQAEQEQEMEPKTINVKFELHRICNFGEQFLVVGNDPMFGSWNPANAIPMTWSEGHLWTLEMGLPAGKFQFKYILKRREGDIIWQPGPDRIIHTWKSMNRIIVLEDWDDALSQKVTEDNEVPITKEEDQPAPSKNEMQIKSEMPNLNSPKEKSKSHATKSKSNATKVTKSKC